MLHYNYNVNGTYLKNQACDEICFGDIRRTLMGEYVVYVDDNGVVFEICSASWYDEIGFDF